MPVDILFLNHTGCIMQWLDPVVYGCLLHGSIECCFEWMLFPMTHVAILPCVADVTWAGCNWRLAQFCNPPVWDRCLCLGLVCPATASWNLWRCWLVHYLVFCWGCDNLCLVACLYCICQLELVAQLTCSLSGLCCGCDHVCLVTVCPAIANWNLWRCLLVHCLVFCFGCDHLRLVACLSCNCQLELVALLTCSFIWSFVVCVRALRIHESKVSLHRMLTLLCEHDFH